LSYSECLNGTWRCDQIPDCQVIEVTCPSNLEHFKNAHCIHGLTCDNYDPNKPCVGVDTFTGCGCPEGLVKQNGNVRYPPLM